jgi:agmatinase
MTPLRYVAQLPHVQSLTQVGIRSIRNSKSNVDASRDDGNRVASLEEARDLDAQELFAAIAPGDAVYVSIDIDVLDMSLVPGCVSAEPDGFTYRELRDRLWDISEQFDVVGFDLVEVNPMLDVATGATSYLAAHTIVEFLGAVTSQSRWQRGRTS